MNQSLGHFVHRAVAAHGHDEATALVESAAGELGRMAGSLGNGHAGIEAVFGDEGAAAVEQRRIAVVSSGARIENKTCFQHGANWVAEVAASGAVRANSSRSRSKPTITLSQGMVSAVARAAAPRR